METKKEYVFTLTKLDCGTIKITGSKFCCLDADGMKLEELISELYQRGTIKLTIEG